MSIHKSLSSRNRLSRARNVLRRGERLKVLFEDGRWEKGQSVYGLPKTKNPEKAKG
jgi:small basic protein (TIGR04137 family)